jgi:hypothetical protein
MQRAASPDRTAPSALPCEWITPFGGPLLPDVNMMAGVSLAVTVSVIASVMTLPWTRSSRSGVHTSRSAGRSFSSA